MNNEGYGMAQNPKRRPEGFASSPGEDTSLGTAAGLFSDLHTAKDAVKELKQAGFTDKQIGLAMRCPDEAEGAGEVVTSTRATQEATTGAVGGGVLGGLAGLLVAAGVVAIPGVGPLLAGGALASSLGITGASAAAGAGIGAAAGGFVGALVGLDIPELKARQFESAIRSGRVLVLVNARGRVSEARAILQRHGGDTDVDDERPSSDHSETLLL
jgi:hypothetical protein